MVRRLWPLRLLVALAVLCLSLVAGGAVSPARATTWPHQGDTLLLIHGLKGGLGVPRGDRTGFDCGAYWQKTPAYLHSSHPVAGQQFTGWIGAVKTIGYYDGDHNCTDNIGAATYRNHCTHANSGSGNGSNDESIYHLSCELAWYIWLNYSQHGQNVQIVAHSMGGLITRYAIYQVTRHFNQDYQMGDLRVHDVVTFATPHGGIPGIGTLPACGSCVEAQEMVDSSAFINELRNGTTTNGVFHPGQNPQGAGGTDWTYMGQLSLQDPVDVGSANFPTGGHKSYFDSPAFDHGGYMGDNSDANDAHIHWCDGCGSSIVYGPVPPAGWHDWTSANHALNHMLHALLLPNW